MTRIKQSNINRFVEMMELFGLNKELVSNNIFFRFFQILSLNVLFVTMAKNAYLLETNVWAEEWVEFSKL